MDKPVTPNIDPVTLAVVRRILETARREMAMTLKKTARSCVLNVAHDYSNAIFNERPEMIPQGQDIPIHLGGLIQAMKEVAKFFGNDLHDGDIIYHNDSAHEGGDVVDCCMYKPVFYQGELAFWTVCKGHMADVGNPPDAGEIFAEGLRIAPVKLWDRGVERCDTVDFMPTDMCSRCDQEGDLKTQLDVVNVGARYLIALLDKYGIETVRACIDQLMDRTGHHMYRIIRAMPDGGYEGRAILENRGRGPGEIEIRITVRMQGDTCRVRIDSPPRIPYSVRILGSKVHLDVS